MRCANPHGVRGLDPLVVDARLSRSRSPVRRDRVFGRSALPIATCRSERDQRRIQLSPASPIIHSPVATASASDSSRSAAATRARSMPLRFCDILNLASTRVDRDAKGDDGVEHRVQTCAGRAAGATAPAETSRSGRSVPQRSRACDAGSSISSTDAMHVHHRVVPGRHHRRGIAVPGRRHVGVRSVEDRERCPLGEYAAMRIGARDVPDERSLRSCRSDAAEVAGARSAARPRLASPASRRDGRRMSCAAASVSPEANAGGR